MTNKERRFKRKLEATVEKLYLKNNLKAHEGLYAGIDEVGVSSIAGPMVAASVVMPTEHSIDKLPVDSKLLKPGTIQELAKKILDEALLVYVFQVSEKRVENWGEDRSRKNLWKRAAYNLREMYPELKIVIDGKEEIFDVYHNPLPNQIAVINADNCYDGVSAAAIVAKAFCDNEMIELGKQHPGYNFAKHKGYPTPEHIENIKKLGLCAAHRQSLINLEKLKTLNEPQELYLTLDQLKAHYQEIIPILQQFPQTASEWELEFLRQQYRFIKKNIFPTPKQQYLIIKSKENILKRAEKQKQVV